MDATNVVKSVEEWRDIPGYEFYYQVSSHGNVRSKDRLVPSKGGFKKTLGRLMKSSINGHGYPQLSLCCESIRKPYSVHQLVAWAFIGAQPKSIQVNHIDGNKTNNHLSNLEYVTQSGNTKHACDTGLINNNKPTASCKLNDQQVREIRRLYALGVKQWQLAKIFDYDQRCAGKIGRGEMYAWVK